MELTYDPEFNIAYIHLKKKSARVRTVAVSEELNVDVAPDGSIYGIELLNAAAQLSADRRSAIMLPNMPPGNTSTIILGTIVGRGALELWS